MLSDDGYEGIYLEKTGTAQVRCAVTRGDVTSRVHACEYSMNNWMALQRRRLLHQK